MIREAETKAKYYETRATIAHQYHQHKMAQNYYRKARIQYKRLKGLLSWNNHLKTGKTLKNSMTIAHATNMSGKNKSASIQKYGKIAIRKIIAIAVHTVLRNAHIMYSIQVHQS